MPKVGHACILISISVRRMGANNERTLICEKRNTVVFFTLFTNSNNNKMRAARVQTEPLCSCCGSMSMSMQAALAACTHVRLRPFIHYPAIQLYILHTSCVCRHGVRQIACTVHRASARIVCTQHDTTLLLVNVRSAPQFDVCRRRRCRVRGNPQLLPKVKFPFCIFTWVHLEYT